MKSCEVLRLIGDIAEKASAKSYIFRGETECNSLVSSRLYRDHESDMRVGGNIEWIQRFELDKAKAFTVKEDEFEILAEIQHYDGSTNLIDFTTDFLIALFFACDGEYQRDGRLIFLDRNSVVTQSPSGPANRVVAQKSIFVRPPTGRQDTSLLINTTLKSFLIT